MAASLDKTVTILLSDKRSGSTLLERELSKHPAVSTVTYTPHSYRETHYWLMAARLFAEPDQLFNNSRMPKSYGSVARTRQLLIQCISGNVPEFQVPDDDRTLVFQGWNALCERYAQPVFFEKSPQHPHHWAALNLMLSWMKTASCKVRILGLVRNPLAVLYSAYQLFGTDPNQRQFSWLQAYLNILCLKAMLDQDEMHVLRYEDLVEHPKQTFAELCRFIGLEYLPSIGESVHGSSKNKWKSDRGFSLQLHSSVVNLATQLGYSAEELQDVSRRSASKAGQFRQSFIGMSRRIKSKLYNLKKRLAG